MAIFSRRRLLNNRDGLAVLVPLMFLVPPVIFAAAAADGSSGGVGVSRGSLPQAHYRVPDADNDEDPTSLSRARRWIALSGYSRYQQRQLQLRSGQQQQHGGGVSQFAGGSASSAGSGPDLPRRAGGGSSAAATAEADASGLQQHLEIRVAEVFSKVAFRNKSNSTTSAPETSDESLVNGSRTFDPPKLMEIVPTTEKTSTAPPPSSSSPQTTTTPKLKEVTNDNRSSRPNSAGEVNSKRRNNNKGKNKKSQPQTRMDAEDGTLGKLGSQGKHILFGSTSPNPSVLSEVTTTAPPRASFTETSDQRPVLIPNRKAARRPGTAANTSAKIVASHPDGHQGDSAAPPIQEGPNFEEDAEDSGSSVTTLSGNGTGGGGRGMLSGPMSVRDTHVYVFLALFAALAAAGVACVLRLASSRPTALSKGYNVSIVVFVVTLAAAQTVALSAEFYGGAPRSADPGGLTMAMATLTLPCLTSGFAVLFLALLDATRLRVTSPYVQNPVSVAGIVVLHFLLAVCGVVTVGDTLTGRFVFLLGQVVFVVWTAGLVFGCAYASRALTRMARTLRLQEAIAGGDGKSAPNLVGPIKIALFVGALMLVTAVVVVYTVVLSVLDSRKLGSAAAVMGAADPWPWWASHIALRVVEWTIGALLLYVARLPRQQERLGVKGGSGCRDTLSTCFSTWRRGHRYRHGISDVTAVWQTQGFATGAEDDDDAPGESEDLYPACCSTNQAVKNFERTTGRPVYSDALAVGNLHLRSAGQEQCLAIAMMPNKRRPLNNQQRPRKPHHLNTLAGHEPCMMGQVRGTTSRVVDLSSPSSDLIRTDIIDRSACSCSRPLSMLGTGDSRYGLREQLIHAGRDNRTSESVRQVDLQNNSIRARSPVLSVAGRRPSLTTSSAIAAGPDRAMSNSPDFHYRANQRSSPAYQLPADFQRSDRPRFPPNNNGNVREGRPVRRHYSNASVQTSRTANTVCVQTCQTSPVILNKRFSIPRDGSIILDNLSSRGSSVFDIDKHISACSSESAAASFDVQMYLTNDMATMTAITRQQQTMANQHDSENEDGFPACDIPDPVIDSNMFLSQISEQSSYNSLPSLEVASLMLPPAPPGMHADQTRRQSVTNCSPHKRRSDHGGNRLLPPTSFRTVLQQHFGNTILMQEPMSSTDITPDSAVVADISQSSAGREEASSFMDDLGPNAPFMDEGLDDEDVHSKRSVASSLSDFWKLSTRSINDLFKSSPVRQSRRRAKDILDKLQGSNFSLNSASRLRQYSPLDCEEVASVSSLKRFCSEYEVHLAEMDSMLNAEMSRIPGEEEDADSDLGAVGLADPDGQQRLLGHNEFPYYSSGHWERSGRRRSRAEFCEEEERFVSRGRRDFDTQTEDTSPVGAGCSYRHQPGPSTAIGEHPMRMESLELLDSINAEEREDYGESDVSVDPDVLKARILKVCDNIRQFSDRPQFGRHNKSVESAF